MRKILVISYKSTILRVHRSVLLKYLRFPDQHIKRNINTGYPTKFYTGSHCPSGNEPRENELDHCLLNEPITHLYIPFLTEKVSSFVYFPLKNGVP